MIPSETEFVERVRATVTRHALFAPGDKVLAAVSGGADSVALLLVLREMGAAVEVAHFDHATRSGESAADAKFVRELAARLGVPFHIEREEIEANAATTALSFEEYARERRYAFLRRTALERGCSIIATGHHAGDQAETVLMRVIRGAGPSGLGGIPPVRTEGGVRIVRPLLDCSRGAIEIFLGQRNEQWREDRTNADTRYVRNRIRHQLLPELSRNYNPRVREALLRLADAQACENELLEALTNDALLRCAEDERRIMRAPFGKLHEALRRRMLLRLAWGCGIECPFERIVEGVAFIATGPTGRRFELGGGVYIHNARDISELVLPLFRTAPATPAAAEPAPEKPFFLRIPGETEAFGWKFTAELLLHAPPEGYAAYCTDTRKVFDADIMAEGVEARLWREGDRFTPLGMTGSKKLGDYFTDIGLPAPERARTPLLVAQGHIIWVVGHAVGAAAAVTPLTRRMLEIRAGH